MTNYFHELKCNKLTIPSFLEHSFNKFSDNNFIGFSDEPSLTYSASQTYISNIIANFELMQLKSGDKVAIFSNNMPNWALVYYAITSMGLVAVPILPDFTETEVKNILEHSESKVIFVSELLKSKVINIKTDYLHSLILINDFSIISSSILASYNHNIYSSSKFSVEEQDIALIIYTSGTTGKSKGVMLSHKNVMFNTVRCGVLQNIFETDVFLSILPLSHAYENTLGLNLPMISGASVKYLRKLATPAVLIPALQEVKPTIMLSVPLIIEKIYKTKILPNFTSKSVTKFLYSIPFIRKTLNKVAGRKLIETFGGRIRFFGIGGAKLDKQTEQFLIEAKFPYSIGYGLTETSPLVAGTTPANVKLGSTGPAIQDIELKLENINPQTQEGEIWVKGDLVMQGYYKDIEATNQVLTSDGWFKTGDLASIDSNGYISIIGRLKNVIIGASGENIYPEEIESEINKFNSVIESLVVKKGGKLVAMVHLNKEDIELKYNNLKISFDEKLELYKSELKIYINSKVNKFSNVSYITIQNNPFEKTPTQKIKRYKYN